MTRFDFRGKRSFVLEIKCFNASTLEKAEQQLIDIWIP